MAQTPLADDIAFVRQMAEEGASAPSLGGRFSLLWGTLLTITLLLHWGAFAELGPVGQANIGYVWLAFVGLGIVGQVALSASLNGKPGASAPGNRAGTALWCVIGPGLGLYFLSILAAIQFRSQSIILFNTIMPAAFLLYATGAAGVGVLTRGRSPWGVVAICLICSALTMFLVNTAEAYLVAAAGVFLSQVIPGYRDLRAEPSSVV